MADYWFSGRHWPVAARVSLFCQGVSAIQARARSAIDVSIERDGLYLKVRFHDSPSQQSSSAELSHQQVVVWKMSP